MSNNTGTGDNEQQRQQRQTNRVRGPTSALSSFLREHGIHVENRSRRERREQIRQQQEEEATPTATPTPEIERETSPQDGAAADPQSETIPILYAPATARRRTRSEASSTIVKAAKKRKKDDSGDENASDSGNSFQPGPSRRKETGRRRFCIVFCSKCNSRFTQPISTAEDSGKEYICPACLKGASSGSSKTPRRRTAQAKRGKGAMFGSNSTAMPSLQDLCIDVVACHIEDVEAFGDVSFINMDKIAQIICRNRKLTNHTARLFMEPQVDDMRLYDCTNVDEIGLINIAQFCVRLRQLKLVYCGRMTDAVLREYEKRLDQLTVLELFGPFLVREETWVEFFKKRGSQLDTFSLSHSARFTKPCIEALVDNCTNLRHLRLLNLTKLDADWLDTLARLQHLQTLEIKCDSEQEYNISEAVVNLLNKAGNNLIELSLRECQTLSDDVLIKGILTSCPKLQKLRLTHCSELTSEGFQKLFSEWKTVVPGRGLKKLDLHRSSEVDDKALQCIVKHSYKSLCKLNVHSLHALTETGLEELTACKDLVKLDCGFVRSINDLTLEKIISSCPKLESIKAFGCHQLTEGIVLRPGLRLEGLEKPIATVN